MSKWLSKKYFFLFIIVVIAFAALIFNKYYYAQKESPPESISTPGYPPASQVPTPTTATGTIQEAKTYRNTEFGFEFKYPNGWTFHENTFYSPFSKFNLVGASPEEKGHPDPLSPSLLVNIVTSDFADRAFYDLKNTASETRVGGIMGSEYRYEYEELPKIAIVLPFGQYKMILGADKEHEDAFNQILATFKFLK